MVVSGRALTDGEKASLGRRLSHASLPCPAHGLDLVAYRLAVITERRRVPDYEFSISSGAEWDDQISFGGPYPGGIVDLALARERGGSIRGPEPGQIMDTYPVPWVISELRSGVDWHRARVHDPFHDPFGANAVLNACRALYYLHHGAFASKSEGARWLLSLCPAPVVAGALGQREGRRPHGLLDRSEVLEFLGFVGTQLGNGAL